MAPFNRLRRSPLLYLAGLVTAGVALWIGYFLATFDLDLYRDRLAEELGNQLQMPVSLGKAQLELREAGIAFRFADLQIGTAQTPAELTAPKLWLQLAWHGLLFGRLVFSEVALDAPHLRIAPHPASPGSTAPPASGLPLELPGGLHIRRVEVQQGSLVFGWSLNSGETRSLTLNDIRAEIADVSAGSKAAFNLTGNLAGGKGTRVAIKGAAELSATGALDETAWDLAVEGKALDLGHLAGMLPERTGIDAAGEGVLTASLNGSGASGIAFRAELTGQKLQLHAGSSAHQRVPFNRLHLAGTWKREGTVHRLRQLALEFDELRLAGDFSFHTGEDVLKLDGVLGDCTLTGSRMKAWLSRQEPPLPAWLEQLQPTGVLTLREAAFRAEWPTAAAGRGRFAFDRLNGSARDFAWDIGRGNTVVLKAVEVSLDNGKWQIERGAATVARMPVTFSGSAALRPDGNTAVDVVLTGSGSATQLAALWPDTLPPEVTLGGNLKLQGQIRGATGQLAVDAHLDLSALAIRYGDHLHLPPTAGSALVLHGTATRTSLAIERGTLALPPLSGTLAGTVDWSGPATVDLATRLELADLTAAGPLVPAVDRLELRGGAALDLTVRGPAAAVETNAILDLQNIAMPMHGIIADINQLNGQLIFTGNGIRSEKLTARLGKSPVILQARVADLQKPRLELGVRASAVRADELIFHSDRAILRDLSGQLSIDREGLDFTPVNVRLDGGTRASVRGTIRDFAAPRVELDISGDYANIKELIGLWTDESPAAEAARKARRGAAPHPPFPPVQIRVDAKAGDLFGMKFQKARALIVPDSRQLLIHPLDFSIDKGYCTTQVLVDYAGDRTRLRVSGHAEDIDAYAVYNELLQRKSILRGKLRGDFYLEGTFGENGFLPSTFGNFNVTVKDGVLRHSPILATVFSLLNVSQLLTMQLPDVSREGVPFSQLTAEARLDRGVLSSDNLVIDSNAMSMSYIGKYDMLHDNLDLLLVVKPLGTIDKVVSHLPIAGWILGGEQRALITAQFKVRGPAENPEIVAIPISAISKGVLGIFQRTLGLPFKLVEDPSILWGGGGKN
ncbi:MAG: hypothetical protein FDZ69_10995 [Deltaproteobacteria bacterium]|nr:MAG: hypothetical protein FDZ69_10995 [Deltaproteobacteria bacterium]